jgi:hypothetical protein
VAARHRRGDGGKAARGWRGLIEFRIRGRLRRST